MMKGKDEVMIPGLEMRIFSRISYLPINDTNCTVHLLSSLYAQRVTPLSEAGCLEDPISSSAQ